MSKEQPQILLVEDDPKNLELARDLLELEDYEVLAAASGERALEVLVSASPDLILLDIQLPGMDGYEVIRRARQELSVNGTPVIAMSAMAMPDEIEKARDAGFDGYITKPITVDEFPGQIAGFLGRRCEERSVVISVSGPAAQSDAPVEGTVLIVDDNKTNLMLLEDYLTMNGYHVRKATSGSDALDQVRIEQPDLVMLDVMMPDIDGYEVCRRLKSDPETRLVPVVLVTALDEQEVRVRGMEAGAEDLITKPFQETELAARVRSLVSVKQLNDELENVENVLYALANAIGEKYPGTRGHTERVAVYAVELGREAGLLERDLRTIERAALLHDIGKIGIPEALLLKPGVFTPEEYDQIKEHATKGEKICRPLKRAGPLLQIIRHHHERTDGGGYPDGLEGDQIPLGARMIAIADAYDAMTSDRSYRPAMARDQAVATLREGAGTQWDEHLVHLFIDTILR